MVQIAGGIILAAILLIIFWGLLNLMFVGFAKSPGVGCLTMTIFGAIAALLATCVFG